MSKNGLILIFLLFIGVNLGLDFKEHKHKNGLLFMDISRARISYDSYTLVYHFELDKYLNIINIIQDFGNNVINACDRINSGTCRIFANLISNQITHMKRDEIDIQAFQQKAENKNKRSIEFIGKIANWAFGLLDADSAREYDNKINEIKNSAERFHNILKDQTTLIKETIKMTNMTLSQMQLQINKLESAIRNYIEAQRSHITYVYTEISIHEAINIITFLSTEHQRVSNQIIKCLDNALSGKITQLVPVETLAEDLFYLHTHLEDNQKLPIYFGKENPLHVFKYSTSAASLYGNRLLVEITIPIIERESYSLLHIIPIPSTFNNQTFIIKPTTQYFLINDQGNEYIPISNVEYTKGKYNIQGEKILKPAENAHLDYSEQCEINMYMNPSKSIMKDLCDIKLIPNANYFVPIEHDNMYFITINSPIVISEHCRGKISENNHISTDGILRLSKYCRINTEKISIRPRISYKLESKNIIELSKYTENITIEIFTKKFESFRNISIPGSDKNILIQNTIPDFNNLIDQADNILDNFRSETKFKEIHYDQKSNNIYNYIVMILIAVIILLAIVGVIYYIRMKFFSIETWVKLARALERQDPDRVPRLFVQN